MTVKTVKMLITVWVPLIFTHTFIKELTKLHFLQNTCYENFGLACTCQTTVRITPKCIQSVTFKSLCTQVIYPYCEKYQQQQRVLYIHGRILSPISYENLVDPTYMNSCRQDSLKYFTKFLELIRRYTYVE